MKRLDVGVLDTSAVFSILNGEPSSPAFLQGFKSCNQLIIGATTLCELSMVVRIKKGMPGVAILDQLLAGLDVASSPTDLTQLVIFRKGLNQYGKGVNSASLNFGDLFSYSLAKHLDAHLFFQGRDFIKTDVKNAMEYFGYAYAPNGEPLLQKQPDRDQ